MAQEGADENYHRITSPTRILTNCQYIYFYLLCINYEIFQKDAKIPMDASNIPTPSARNIHHQAARVHRDLLEQFISLTTRARNESSDSFLHDSLDDQIEWLSGLKASYLI